MDNLPIMAVRCKAGLVRFVSARSSCICNKYARQIHIVFTCTLKIDFLQAFTSTDCESGRRKEFIPVNKQLLNELC